MTITHSLEGALCNLGLYKPARDTYQRIWNRPYFAERQRARRFYRPLIPRSGLVFDVGANHGHRTELFLELGARVVAVEPLPELAEMIGRRYPSRHLTVESCAVGARSGTATLRVGVNDAHSTISDDWVDTIGPGRWDGTVQVPVRTLDDVIAEHGTPAFVKIDVEGHEAQVLEGLTVPPAGLSFEFQSLDLEAAVRCLERLDRLGGYRYRVTRGERLEFEDGGWTDRAAVTGRLRDLAAREPGTHGDVYAVLA